MSYIIHHYLGNLTKLTGFRNGDELSEEQVIKIMREAKVNILIFHQQKTKHNEANDFIYIDDIKMRFQQR